MKHFLIAVATITLLIFSTNVHSQMHRVTGSKKYITKEVKVANFNEIRLMGSPDIVYTQTSGKTGVQIYGSDNIVDLLEVTVVKGALVVKFKNNTRINNSGTLEVRVSNPGLKSISVQGSGDIKMANNFRSKENLSIYIQGSGDVQGRGINCNELSLSIQGSGDISAHKVSSSLVTASIEGSGDIELSGTTKEANYQVAGSGDINATDLKVSNADIQINGSGDIGCQVTSYMKVRVNGSGEVAYKGNPQIDSTRKKGLRKL